jgi:hypothetical protein
MVAIPSQLPVVAGIEWSNDSAQLSGLRVTASWGQIIRRHGQRRIRPSWTPRGRDDPTQISRHHSG